MRFPLPKVGFSGQGRVNGVGAGGFEVVLALGVGRCTKQLDAPVVRDELVSFLHVGRFRLDLVQRIQCSVVIFR